MSNKIYDQHSAELASLMRKPTTWTDEFHKLKSRISNKILSVAYGVGLGYTTLAESYDAYNSDLFREIIIEAQPAMRKDESVIFTTIVKGNLYEVQLLLNEIESSIKAKVEKEMIGKKPSEIALETRKRIRASTIYSNDVAGANIVHLAYLFKHYHIGHYLVKRYPRLASLPYSGKIDVLDKFITDLKHNSFSSPALYRKYHELRKRLGEKVDAVLEENMLYTGENVLHMTIMRRNYEETRWLLDFYRDHAHSFPDCLPRLLNTDATGKFFDSKGSFYVGSNPLQFAVCSNSTAIFDLVYSFVSGLNENTDGLEDNRTTTTQTQYVGPDVIFATDKFGNNVLHLCVLHGLTSMYEHVYNTAMQVMRRKLHNEFIKKTEESAQGTGADISLGFRIGCSLDDMNNYAGYRLCEKVLHLPRHPGMLRDWMNTESRRKVDERLVLALNEDLHSPLTLAASIINKNKDSPEEMEVKLSMLRFLVEKMKQKLWEYGPVTMSVVNLEGIEIKYNVLEHYECAGRQADITSKSMHSAISWLCINDSDKAISIPEIERIIQSKWERVGYPFFILSFLINCFITICVTLILVFINATPSDNTSYSTEIAVNILYIIVAGGFFVMFLQETHDFMRFWNLLAYRGVAFYDKALRVIKVLSFVSFCCCKAVAANRQSVSEQYSVGGATVLYDVRDDQGMKVSIVVCIIACYLHLYYFFMGFDGTGPFVLTMFRIISSDVPYFINFYLIVVVAFACALSVLARSQDPTAGYGFAHVIKATWTLIQDTVGIDATHDNINTVRDYPQHLQWLADILLTAYFITVIILMLNLLIAMISNTYEAYCEYNGAILLIAKYNIMNAMECVMWDDELQENRFKYAQIDENTVLETVDEVRAKPIALLSTRTHSRKRAETNISETLATSDTKKKVQMRYMFELQTVNHHWYNNEEKESKLSMDAGKIADAVTTALGGTRTATKTSSAKSRKTALFIIDPQVDFHPGGTLAIATANEDSQRIADMIDSFGEEHIHDIFVSMDSHSTCHIAHAVSWHAAGKPDEHPAPFTQISNSDVINGVWVYVDKREEMQEWAKAYTGALERKGRMVLTIWPEHCIVGSKGHSVVPVINNALQRWAHRSGRPVNYIMKGQNLRVEMYSAIQAEVHDPLDQNTGVNLELLSVLKTSDRLLICGQAMSHCVNYTTRDIIDHWDKAMGALVVLTDGASPVQGFKVDADEFLRHCASKGVSLHTISEAFEGCKAKAAI